MIYVEKWIPACARMTGNVASQRSSHSLDPRVREDDRSLQNREIPNANVNVNVNAPPVGWVEAPLADTGVNTFDYVRSGGRLSYDAFQTGRIHVSHDVIHWP